jgi:hypothetical protein
MAHFNFDGIANAKVSEHADLDESLQVWARHYGLPRQAGRDLSKAIKTHIEKLAETEAPKPDTNRKKDLEKFMEDSSGITDVTSLSKFLGMPMSTVRNWARDNGVKRIGSTFAFSKDKAKNCSEDLLG